MTKTKLFALSAAVLSVSMWMPQANATTISLDYNPTEFASTQGQQALSGFQQAANFWETFFSDNITVNLGIGFSALPQNVIGSTRSYTDAYYYQDVAVSLFNDQKSIVDNIAVGSLPCDQQGNNNCNVRFLDQENPGAPVSPELDADGSVDNFALNINQANAKALGLGEGIFGWSALDAEVNFSSEFSFDFDRTDGIDLDKMDFVGVAIHEIGHALGFVSSVDTYDLVYNSGQYDPNTDLDGYALASVLDLFRFSQTSVQAGEGVRDWTPGSNAYFSIDNGATIFAPFSTGSFGGDGRQASHFKDNLGIGIMDPTFSFGEFGDITILDLIAFDAIGWDVNYAALPEPSTIAIFGLALVGLAFRRSLNAQ